MSVKVFRLQGTYQRKNRTLRFSKEFRALTEEHAREQLYSQIGSFFRIKRAAITIEQVDEINALEAESPLIRQLSNTE
jgi:large subunit ribosomal protein LX